METTNKEKLAAYLEKRIKDLEEVNSMTSDVAAGMVMDLVDDLPEEKAAMFFLNLFGFEGLSEMAYEIIEGRIESGNVQIDRKDDVAKFVNTMII